MREGAQMKIVIATGNPHKVEEMREIFRDPALGLVEFGVEFVGLGEVEGGPFPEPRETGVTFEQNATIKALTYASATGMWCLADDSGLEIDALDGRPGVISSHYCTDGREEGMGRAERDARNNERVLREMAGVAREKRTARFVCVMCLARPAETLVRVRGTFEGRIGMPAGDADGSEGGVPRGEHGFGYDPIFLLPAPDARTSAELSADDKNARSHRGAAARLLAGRLRQVVEKDA